MTFGYGLSTSGTTFGSLGSTYGTNGLIDYKYIYDEEYQKTKYECQETQLEYENTFSSKISAVSTKVDDVITYLSSGREDITIQAYQQLVDVIKSQNPDMNDEEVMAFARNEIEGVLSQQLGKNVSLINFIRDNAANVNEQATQKTLFFDDTIDKATEEDLLLLMCNIKEEKKQTGGNKFKNGLINVVTFGLSEVVCGIFGPDKH